MRILYRNTHEVIALFRQAQRRRLVAASVVPAAAATISVGITNRIRPKLTATAKFGVAALAATTSWALTKLVQSRAPIGQRNP